MRSETSFGVKNLRFRELLKSSRRPLPSPFLTPRWPLPPEIIGNGQRMRTRSRCGRQSTICCLKALFVLLRTCLRYCVCYCLIRNYGRWPCFCEDQLHLINTGYRPDRYCQNCSWCDHYMPFKNDFLYLKTGARTNAPQRPNTCFLSQRKRQTGTLSAGMYFFSFSETFCHVGSAI